MDNRLNKHGIIKKGVLTKYGIVKSCKNGSYIIKTDLNGSTYQFEHAELLPLPEPEALENCPFCGGKAEVVKENFKNGNYFVTCVSEKERCPAKNMVEDGEMGTAAVSFEFEAEAIITWNERA